MVTQPIVGDNPSGNPIPVYFKLQLTLQSEIEDGRWEPGQLFPTERKIAEEYQISIGTVKKALLNLVSQGYLYRIQGKGTFVGGTALRHNSVQCPHYYSVRNEFSNQDADLKVKFSNVKIVKAFQPIIGSLGIKANQDIIELERLFILEKKPIVHCISYMPSRLFKNLQLNPQKRFEESPLCIIIEKDYNLPTLYNHELYSTAQAGEKTAKALQINTGTTVLLLETLSFTYRNKPYEYRKSYCLTTEKKLFRKF